jgi:hypothetical protein
MGVKKKIKVYLREKCCKDGISTVAVLVLVWVKTLLSVITGLVIYLVTVLIHRWGL